jgi:hypothetical protein
VSRNAALRTRLPSMCASSHRVVEVLNVDTAA